MLQGVLTAKRASVPDPRRARCARCEGREAMLRTASGASSLIRMLETETDQVRLIRTICVWPCG